MKITVAERMRAVAVDRQVPERLFSSRRINSITQIPSVVWNQSGRIYLSLPDDDARSLVRASGAMEDPRYGVFIQRESQVPLTAINPFLPRAARIEMKPVLADLIPASSWGSSLSNILVQSCWDGIRKRVFSTATYRCKLCGSSRDLECHELWEYHEPCNLPMLPEGMSACGVQRLRGLVSLCDACHEMFHLGFAKTRGRLELALERIRAVNRWSKNESLDYYDFIGQRWTRRSQHEWVLDLSVFHDEVLVVKSNWVSDEQGFLIARGPSRTSQTMLLGVRWKHAQSAVIHGPISPDVAYFV